ncbi:MAG: nidogen-like domain-containing protein [Bacteroidota bacterium]
MKHIITISCLTCILSFCTSQLRADCPVNESILLVSESFEDHVPADWELPTARDGDSWSVDANPIGYYANPGENKWLYLNDERNDKIGTGELLTAAYDLSAFPSFLQLEFDFNFQEYSGKGNYQIDIWDGDTWQKLHHDNQDVIAHFTIDITAYASESVRFRFKYDDGETWGWGMGIDNFQIIGLPDACGNGICDYGEVPGECEDCIERLFEPKAWIAAGKDIQGRSVNYQNFNAAAACDDCYEAVELGFDFNFFGETYQSAFLNANGNLTFEDPYAAFTPEAFCLAGPKMIAPFFADVDLTRGGEVNYYADPEGTYFIARWEEVAFFGCEGEECDQRNSFQMILTNGKIRAVGDYILPLHSNILFVYRDMQWTAGKSSGGTGGFGGAPATVGLNQGDGTTCDDYGIFDRDGYAYYGNHQDDLCTANAVSHLDNHMITFNGVEGQNTVALGEIVLKGQELEEGVELVWCTDLMEHAEFFVLERRAGADNAVYEEITTIYPEDPLLNQPGEYIYIDENAKADTNYYRITLVQSNGELNYSPVAKIAFGEAGTGTFNTSLNLDGVGPNPLQEQLSIRYSLSSNKTIEYKLLDMAGRMILRGSQNGLAGENHFSLNLPRLSSAMYVISLTDGQEVVHMNLIKE